MIRLTRTRSEAAIHQNFREAKKRTFEQDTQSQIRNTIEGMKAPGAEFAGMIRYFDILSEF